MVGGVRVDRKRGPVVKNVAEVLRQVQQQLQEQQQQWLGPAGGGWFWLPSKQASGQAARRVQKPAALVVRLHQPEKRLIGVPDDDRMPWADEWPGEAECRKFLVREGQSSWAGLGAVWARGSGRDFRLEPALGRSKVGSGQEAAGTEAEGKTQNREWRLKA
jgi:hypothetical protein